MPRTYQLGERAVQMRETRDRIIEAAIELYTVQGISATSMRQVQLRADVAPGTLRNHFPARDHLDRAMVERLTAEAPLPELSVFEGAATLEARLERLVRATVVFIEQAGRIYRMWLREPMLTPPWNEVGARYGARWSELWRTALGPLADDDDALTVLRAISDPTFIDAIRASGRSTDEVSGLVAGIVVPWFSARAAALTSS
jgi:AcrR family transcriptional regulator